MFNIHELILIVGCTDLLKMPHLLGLIPTKFN